MYSYYLIFQRRIKKSSKRINALYFYVQCKEALRLERFSVTFFKCHTRRFLCLCLYVYISLHMQNFYHHHFKSFCALTTSIVESTIVYYCVLNKKERWNDFFFPPQVHHKVQKEVEIVVISKLFKHKGYIQLSSTKKNIIIITFLYSFSLYILFASNKIIANTFQSSFPWKNIL